MQPFSLVKYKRVSVEPDERECPILKEPYSGSFLRSEIKLHDANPIIEGPLIPHSISQLALLSLLSDSKYFECPLCRQKSDVSKVLPFFKKTPVSSVYLKDPDSTTLQLKVGACPSSLLESLCETPDAFHPVYFYRLSYKNFSGDFDNSINKLLSLSCLIFFEYDFEDKGKLSEYKMKLSSDVNEDVLSSHLGIYTIFISRFIDLFPENYASYISKNYIPLFLSNPDAFKPLFSPDHEEGFTRLIQKLKLI